MAKKNVHNNYYGATEKDPTYPATASEVINAAKFGEPLTKAKQMLVCDRIVFLQSASISAARDPLNALKYELSTEFSLRTCESTSFDLNFFRRANTPYEKPSVTYLDLFNAPLDTRPLMQADYVSKIQSCLKKQNNHLILVVGREAFEETDSLHAASNLHRWKIQTQATDNKIEAADINLDNAHAMLLTYLCAFFPGLDVAEIDHLMMALIRASGNEKKSVEEEPEEKENDKKEQPKQVQTWDSGADEIARISNIAYLDRDNEGVGYYFIEAEREEQVQATLIRDYPQYVMRQTVHLLNYYFVANQPSHKFFNRFLELLTSLEQRRSSVLGKMALSTTFSERVLNDQSNLALNRFCLLVWHLKRHSTTRLVVHNFLAARLTHIKNELDGWDHILTRALGKTSIPLDEVHGWLQQNDAILQDYNKLIGQLDAIFMLLIAGADWRSGRNVELVHELTRFKHRENTHAHDICQRLGLFRLFEHLLNNWQDIEDYGKQVLEFHQNKNKPRADLMLDAFNLAIRQIVNNCVFNEDWQAAQGVMDQLQTPKNTLAETIAEVTLAKVPYRPSVKAITLALTQYGTMMAIQENAPKKDMSEIAHFYEKLARALVRYTDKFAEDNGERKAFLRRLIRAATGPLMNRLKSEQRRELRDALRIMQEKHKAYRAQHPEIKRGTKRHDIQLLIAEAMRMLLGNLRIIKSRAE